VYHRFGQVELGYDGFALGVTQFCIMNAPNMMLTLKSGEK